MLNALPAHQGVVAVVWLAVIVLFILGASRVARLLPQRLRPAALQTGAASQENALTLRGSVALDLRRRVYLVEADGRSALILTGGTADVMLALKQADH